jgi:F-type H+-transporting ATPase subunit b
MEGLTASDILIHIINIVVLFILLRVILIKPISKFLTARSERIVGDLKDAETKKAEALELKSEYEAHMQAYEEEGREMIRQSQLKATDEGSAIVRDARSQAEKIIAEARSTIESERVKAIAQARTEVALLATEIAARILKREVTTVDNKAVAEDFFREMR